MLVVPYSTALSLGRPTYVTFGFILVCLLAHVIADYRVGTIEARVNQYCARIAASDTEAGYMKDSEELCQIVLFDRHDVGSELAYRKYLLSYVEDIESLSRDEAWELLAEVERHYNHVAAGMPSFLQNLMAHYPPSLNPVPMVLSNFSHVDWWHLMGNLAFFYAFAAPVEAVVGPLVLLFSTVALSLVCGVAYSVFCFFACGCLPTVGLSGVVMGVIGMAAFLIPRARVNKVILSGIVGWRFSIPAWILALFFIVGDLFDLLGGGMDDAPVNFLAHVVGGIGGYLGAALWLRPLRDRMREDVDDAIELAAIDRHASGGSLARERISRRQLANAIRAENAEKEKREFSEELYRYVRADNAPLAQLLLLKEYDAWHRSPEIYEDLFAEIDSIKRGRSWLCAGRLCIHLYAATGRYGKAVAIAEQLAAEYPHLELTSPAEALQIAHEAIGMNRERLAHALLGTPTSRYGGLLDAPSSERLLG